MILQYKNMGFTLEEIKNIINRNDRQLCLAIVQIYNCQTDDEKLYKETSHDNGIGFNAFDSEILSSFAEQYLERVKDITDQEEEPNGDKWLESNFDKDIKDVNFSGLQKGFG